MIGELPKCGGGRKTAKIKWILTKSINFYNDCFSQQSMAKNPQVVCRRSKHCKWFQVPNADI